MDPVERTTYKINTCFETGFPLKSIAITIIWNIIKVDKKNRFQTSLILVLEFMFKMNEKCKKIKV